MGEWRRRVNRLLRSRLWRSRGGTVWSGPFAGLPVSEDAVLCALLGTYELEIHPWFVDEISRGFARVVVVGAADGYEVAGFLRCVPGADAVAFEADPDMQKRLSDMVTRSGLGTRVRVEGFATAEALARATADVEGRVLVLIDVDGGEDTLTGVDAFAALEHATVIIETHDIFVPGIHAAVRGNLAASHLLEEVTSRPRTIADLPSGAFPLLRHLIPGPLAHALDERRPGPQRWIRARPR
ncbi:MAG: hypothetical protein K2X99_08030 [Gemmatimonadaceae bacterium]|nr:hypothetical protein [Gemmatimonadaceae bacterium]